jgi:hypothetical protein
LSEGKGKKIMKKIMKKIRRSVFETNSSSSHSISIADTSGLMDTLPLNEDGGVVLTGGEYGWEWKKYNDAWNKANYCAQFAHGYSDLREMLKSVITEQTGAKYVALSTTEEDGYVDHQSAMEEGGKCVKAFASPETLRKFIFDKKSWLFLGNDNSEAPDEFYDEK